MIIFNNKLRQTLVKHFLVWNNRFASKNVYKPNLWSYITFKHTFIEVLTNNNFL